jgi:hypothetical protein
MPYPSSVTSWATTAIGGKLRGNEKANESSLDCVTSAAWELGFSVLGFRQARHVGVSFGWFLLPLRSVERKQAHRLHAATFC